MATPPEPFSDPAAQAAYDSMMAVDMKDPDWISKTSAMADEYHRRRECRERRERLRFWIVVLGVLAVGVGGIVLLSLAVPHA